MTWTKLDDGFYDSPKVVIAGNEAAGVFARALSYCGKHLTDGKIPKPVAELIAGRARPIQTLVDVGLWVEDGEVYVIPDFLEFNPSATEVEERRAMRAAAGRRGGLASGKARSNGSSKREASASARGKANA